MTVESWHYRRQGVITTSRAEHALDLLLLRYRGIHPEPTSELLPTIDEANPEEQIRRICAVALAGSATQYGAALGTYHALGGFCDYLGIKSLIDARDVDQGLLSTAAWFCLHGATMRTSSESVTLIRGSIRVADYLLGDFASVAHMDAREVRKVVRTITPEPVPALAITQLLGAAGVRPVTSGGSAGLLTKIGCLDWTSFLFVNGSQAPRLAAMEYLERLEPDAFMACEFFGSLLCPEDCIGGAGVCPAGEFCYAREKGLVQQCLL